MDESLAYSVFLNRLKFFAIESESADELVSANSDFFHDIFVFKNRLLEHTISSDACSTLQDCFSQIFQFIEISSPQVPVFTFNPTLRNLVYEASFFTALNIFLHETNQTKKKTYARFVYENSINNYWNFDSPSYCGSYGYNDNVKAEAANLRKRRQRLLSSRAVYSKSSQWSAISPDSEYEWKLFFPHKLSDKDEDTLKRIGNLYKDISPYLSIGNSSTISSDELLNAYKKFRSKLKKIRFDNYLSLSHNLLDYLSQDSTYWGMNLYRLEKELKPYAITSEVKLLLNCQTTEEQAEILLKSHLLSQVWFPKVYDKLFAIHNVDEIALHQKHFGDFLSSMVLPTCLILDEFVEHGHFGTNWEQLFLGKINEMADKVLYTVDEIDFSVLPNSQEAFEKTMSTHVRSMLLANGIPASVLDS